MTIEADAENSFDKIQHSLKIFFISHKNRNRVELPELDKECLWNPTANIIFNGEKLILSAKIGDKAKMSVLTTLIQHSAGGPTSAIR